ncbi:MAG: hypothetical protein HOP25_08145 [Methylotenera sp.]|nr:hypothetical protein [Methylotenera sp.]
MNKFITKAEKTLKWCELSHAEMIEHSELINMDLLERSFTSLLTNVDIVHESLLDASKLGNAHHFKEELNKLRNDDELLFYFWKARNSITHDALIVWRPSMAHLQVKVVNPEAVEKITRPFNANSQHAIFQLMCFLFGASNKNELIENIKKTRKPPMDKLEIAGVEFHNYSETFCLDSFQIRQNGKSKIVKTPEVHLGLSTAPSANLACKQIISFYSDKINTLKSMLCVD